MTRRTLALLALAAVAVTGQAVVPVQAKASPYVVYEVYRVRSAGPTRIPVRVRIAAGPSPAIFMYVGLGRDDEGRWTARHSAVSMWGNGENTWRTYGWPAAAGAPPSCPAEPFCGSAGGGPLGATAGTMTFQADTVSRFLVAAPRGRVSLMSLSGWWRVRESTAAFRTVTAEQSDATGLVSGMGRYEHFRSASAPAGAYGSVVYANPPCGVGSVRLSEGDAQPVPATQPTRCDSGFQQSSGARKWTLAGSVVGEYAFGYRLAVLDFPRR